MLSSDFQKISPLINRDLCRPSPLFWRFPACAGNITTYIGEVLAAADVDPGRETPLQKKDSELWSVETPTAHSSVKL